MKQLIRVLFVVVFCFGIIKPVLADESSYPYYGKAYGIGGGDMEAMTSSVAPAPRIEAGSEEITVSVYVRYEIR